MKIACQISTVLVLAFCLAMGVDLVVQGASGLQLDYFTAPVLDSGRAGGIGPVTVSTLAIVSLAILFATPVSLGGAILGVELLVRHPNLSGLVRRAFNVLVSVPSIAVGLVGWSLFCQGLGLGFSILSGSLTLALMLIPIMTAAFIGGLDAVSTSLRRESLALGVSRWHTLWLLVIPSARPALVAGLMLAIGRATAETAALILTSGISVRFPEGVLDPGATLAVHMYYLARNVPGGEPRAYTAALALLLINVVIYFSLSRIGRTGKA